jgi:DNA-directed RNA polymerase subunit M/transcription elongation factor TFIIS
MPESANAETAKANSSIPARVRIECDGCGADVPLTRARTRASRAGKTLFWKCSNCGLRGSEKLTDGD